MHSLRLLRSSLLPSPRPTLSPHRPSLFSPHSLPTHSFATRAFSSVAVDTHHHGVKDVHHDASVAVVDEATQALEAIQDYSKPSQFFPDYRKMFPSPLPPRALPSEDLSLVTSLPCPDNSPLNLLPVVEFIIRCKGKTTEEVHKLIDTEFPESVPYFDKRDMINLWKVMLAKPEEFATTTDEFTKRFSRTELLMKHTSDKEYKEFHGTQVALDRWQKYCLAAALIVGVFAGQLFLKNPEKHGAPIDPDYPHLRIRAKEFPWGENSMIDTIQGRPKYKGLDGHEEHDEEHH